jgi:molybdenum cofactor cytidylyltransferase
VTDECAVAALVLAAGRSTRMAPRNKLLLRDPTGLPMVARVVLACLRSRVRSVIVVTGSHHDSVEQAVREVAADATFVHAEDHASGLSASLRRGIAAVPAWADAAIVCLGDMPLVDAPLIDRIISAYAPRRGRCVVVPTWQGRRGNPVLWDRRFFAEMADLSGDQGARSLLERHASSVAEVAADDASVLTDFDTVAAWRLHYGSESAPDRPAVD